MEHTTIQEKEQARLDCRVREELHVHHLYTTCTITQEDWLAQKEPKRAHLAPLRLGLSGTRAPIMLARNISYTGTGNNQYIN